jgi:hypothetical protein
MVCRLARIINRVVRALESVKFAKRMVERGRTRISSCMSRFIDRDTVPVNSQCRGDMEAISHASEAHVVLSEAAEPRAVAYPLKSAL